MSGTQNSQSMTARDEGLATGHIGVDVEYLHYAFGDLSVAEMDIHSCELYKK